MMPQETKQNKLAYQRTKKRLSQSQLAKLSNVNLRMIQKYENGERDFMKSAIETAIKLADALEITLDELCRYFNEPT